VGRSKSRAGLTVSGLGGMVRAVGKHDRRNSMKMKRLKGQAKKKARLKRRVQERKAAVVGVKKAAAPRRASKAAPPPAAPPSAPATE
jgi:hypothetical protein